MDGGREREGEKEGGREGMVGRMMVEEISFLIDMFSPSGQKMLRS